MKKLVCYNMVMTGAAAAASVTTYTPESTLSILKEVMRENAEEDQDVVRELFAVYDDRASVFDNELVAWVRNGVYGEPKLRIPVTVSQVATAIVERWERTENDDVKPSNRVSAVRKLRNMGDWGLSASVKAWDATEDYDKALAELKEGKHR